MLPEIGNFFLILSFMTACFIFSLSSYSHYFNKEVLDLSRLTFLNTIFIFTSFIFLEIAFLSDDFSVLYVASNSNPLLPNYFKFNVKLRDFVLKNVFFIPVIFPEGCLSFPNNKIRTK